MTITFVGPIQSRFVQNDIAILSTQHRLRIVDSNMGRGHSAAFNLIKLHLKIVKSLFTSDALFFWFADYYSFIPTMLAKLAGKKIYVVAGGFDVAYIPEVKSGARTRTGRWYMVRNTFRRASHIFPVSRYALKMLDESVPDHAPATVVYNTVDTKSFPFSDAHRKLMALTVTQLDTVLDYRLKGIDVFINTARRMPDVEFHLVGVRGPALGHAENEAKGLANVHIVGGPIDREKLLEYYHSASAYCQLSIDESFGVATAEAMSCGCIPVVSEVPSLEEVTGGTGHIVSRTDLGAIEEAIRATFAATTSDRRRAADYVSKFDIDVRKRELLSLVK